MKSKSRFFLLEFLVLIAILVGIILFPATVSAQFSQISYIDPAPKIDGEGAEWPSDSIFSYSTSNAIPDFANHLDVQLAWDEQHLYLYAEIRDSRLRRSQDDKTHLYLNDAVELFIDPLDDSANRMDINDYQYIIDYTGATAVLKGDKAMISDLSMTAPKDLGIATVAFQSSTKKLVDENGMEFGFAVELAIPFAGMGATPKAGLGIKIDFCNDDLDSMIDIETLPEGAKIPFYSSSNWEGVSDFSFPENWHHFTLQGGPSVQSLIGKKLAKYWILIVAILVAAATVIFLQARRIAKMRDVLPRTSFDPQIIIRLQQPAENTAKSRIEEERNDGNSLIFKVNSSPIANQPPAANQKHPIVERCQKLLLEKLDQDLRMEELAQHCAISLRQLQRVFKDEMNMSPGNFVIILKMEHAASLLRAGTVNVSETAWQLGFQDSSYFSRVFKKYHGIAPKTFQEMKVGS